MIIDMPILTIVLVIVTVVFLWLGHYFPFWHEWTGRRIVNEDGTLNPRRIILNYVYGTVGWFVPFCVWLWLKVGIEAVLMGWVFLVAGGLAVSLAYWNDKRVGEIRALREAQELNELLERKRELERSDAKESGSRQGGGGTP